MALKDWKRVSGTERTWAKEGRWLSWNFFKGRENPYVVDTIKNGMLEILGRFKTKAKALKLARSYMRSH